MQRISFLSYLVAVLLLLSCSSLPQALQTRAAPVAWPTQGWTGTTPEEQGMDSARLAQALLTIGEQGIDIHSLMIVRNGLVLVDAYFYPYDGQTVHELASVTKSVMTTLIGIAVDQGKLSLDDPMLSFFPERTVANRDASKEAITVRHLASMSSGLDCTSEGDEATLQEMKESTDWVQFTLDRKVRWQPGTHFVYCSPAIHLLSPILQQATGMTALEFARQYLFEPLGIRDVIWLTDPQDFSRGSEGIYLHPHDMAKLGYLWLNHGAWEGEQIVPRKWVEDSVKLQMRFDDGDGYGYGWWVDTNLDSYSAEGRGGQHIGVLPSANVVLVTTGGGFDVASIEPLLVTAVVDWEKPLPANPVGARQLEAAVAAVAQPPAPHAVTPLPGTARPISGKIFVFDPNPIDVDALGVEFDGSATAILHITPAGGEMQEWPIGLDGVYRMSAGNFDLPQGLRGEWVDGDTFACEYDNIANNDHVFLRLSFAGDRVVVEAQETAHEVSAQFEGRLQEP